MANTYATLRDAVGAFMHRAAGTFIVNGNDMLLRSANDAKNFIQRAVDFEKARIFAELAGISVTNGGNLSGTVLKGTATPVVLKSIEKVFLKTSDASVEFPIDFISRSAYVSRLKRRYEHVWAVDDAKMAEPTTQFPLSMIQYGDIVYIAPANTQIFGGSSTFTAFFDAIQWLPDFSTTALTGSATGTSASKLVASAGNFIVNGVRIGDIVTNTTDSTSAIVLAVDSATQLTLNADIFISGEAYSIATVSGTQTNFLLEYCFDCMLFYTVHHLNFFLKEDMRVPLSEKMMERIWNNVINWNNTVVGGSVDDVSLD